jgi:hypothetical protein
MVSTEVDGSHCMQDQREGDVGRDFFGAPSTRQNDNGEARASHQKNCPPINFLSRDGYQSLRFMRKYVVCPI